MKTALLLSGGMDSSCLAWWKRPALAITVNYGQLPAEAETIASQTICETLGIEHHVTSVDCRSLGSGDMAGQTADPLAPASDWWPFRNQLLVTIAAMKAVRLGVDQLLIGTVKSDSTHRDGTGEFLDAMTRLTQLQEGALAVSAPAISLDTVDLVRTSEIPLEILAWAHSCHKANIACGNCRGCNKHFQVWRGVRSGLA